MEVLLQRQPCRAPGKSVAQCFTTCTPVQAKRAALGSDVDINKYVAGGVAVFDLTSHALKWHTHLDLSTDETQYRAHIYSAPTVVDIDNDGSLEILVGTSMVCNAVHAHRLALTEQIAFACGWSTLLARLLMHLQSLAQC